MHTSPPNIIDPDRIKNNLNTSIIGREILYFDEITSTNDKAFELAKEESPEGVVVIADSQTRGRGRLERSWHSPPRQNLYASIILRPNISLSSVSLITLMGGLCIAKTLEGLIGIKPEIKWPNDVLLNNKKTCGILTEINTKNTRISPAPFRDVSDSQRKSSCIEQTQKSRGGVLKRDGINFVILGIGINININEDEFPTEIRKKSTSLFLETGKKFHRDDVLISILSEIERVYMKFLREDPSWILDAWWGYFNLRGRRVEAIVNGKAFKGVPMGLTSSGALIIEDVSKNREVVLAGDVNFI